MAMVTASSSFLWWAGTCIIFFILGAYILWTAKQMLEEDELDSLNAKLHSLKKQNDAWTTGAMHGIISTDASLIDVVLELKIQLKKTRELETSKWSEFEMELQRIKERIDAIEGRLSV